MKRLTLENFKELEPYIKDADYNEYNSNIVTMLMWQTQYPVFFACYENYALVYNQMPEMDPVWLMPYCKAEYRKDAVEKIKELSVELGINFEIHSMVREFKDWLQAAYPKQFLIWDCYDARDYIYDRKQQETLAGKKMQKRRNHFHAFEKLYENRYVYKKLEREDIPHVYEFLQYWKTQKDAMDSITVEEQGIHFLLDHMDILPIQGGCIYVDGKLEAFNITSMVSKDTVQIHVEKANKTMRGLYIAILKLFLETLPEHVTYVNREDDMGLPELRKAKKDMHPISKTNKFGSCYEPWTIRKALPCDLEHIKQLWLDSFEDETKHSTDVYFNDFFHMEDCYVLTSKEELISMLQTRPMEIMLQGKQQTVVFIVGVATSKDYEGCGYMKQLMNEVLTELSTKHEVVLLQAYHWDLYTSFGFEETYHLIKTKLNKDAYPETGGMLESTDDANLLLQLYKQFVQTKDGYRIRNKEYYTSLFLPNAALWNQQVLVYQENNNALGYLVMEEHEEYVDILECIYHDESTLSHMLGALSKIEKKVYLYTDVDTLVEGRRKEVTHMMTKSFLGSIDGSHLFINETL